MRYAVIQKYGRRKYVKSVHEEFIERVEEEGYDVISCSSAPPYGPHIERHRARVWGSYNVDLKDVKVIDEKTEKELLELEKQITELKKKCNFLVASRYNKFRQAKIKDFPVSKVKKSMGKKEAEAKLNEIKDEDKRSAKKRGEVLSRAFGKIL